MAPPPTSLQRTGRDVALYGPNGHLLHIERQGTAAGRVLGQLHRDATRMFQAAERNRTNASWITSAQDINQALSSQLGLMRQRARWLALNDANGASFMNTLLNYCVGVGFDLSMNCVRPVQLDGGWEVEEMEGYNAYVEDRFGSYSRDVMVDASLSSPVSEHEFQEFAFRNWATDGEIFAHAVIDRTRGKDVPLLWEIIDPGQLDCTRMSGINGNPVFMGIELDLATWRPVAYWVLATDRKNPGWSLSTESVRIPAAKMLHVFKRLVPRQLRGVPFFHAVMNRAYQLNQYEDAELVKQKIAALFSVFITGGEGGGTFLGEEGDSETTDANGFPTDADGNVIAHLQPGIVGRLPKGYDVKTVGPSSPEATFAAFVQSQQAAFSAGAGPGMSATGMTRDTSRTTFAGGRMAENMDIQGYRPLMNFFASRLLAARFRMWMDMAVLVGEVTATTYDVDPDYWRRHTWKPGGWSRGINPLQEVQAAARSMELGLTTLDDECSYGGRDYRLQIAKKAKIQRAQLKEFARTKALAEELGLDQADLAAALNSEFGEVVSTESTSVTTTDQAERAVRDELAGAPGAAVATREA